MIDALYALLRTTLLIPTLARSTVVRSKGVTSVTRGVRVGRVAQGTVLRLSRMLVQTACMCVGYQFPLRAVTDRQKDRLGLTVMEDAR